jgi:NDP-4-keto-2,6-dideoxyhexose 3-C-methyltransferase
MYTEIKKCRICGNPDLAAVLSLGNQALTGVFPRSKDQPLTSGPLELVKCHSDSGDPVCGLLQLRHSYPLGEMYGQNYGYRSGLNRSMVEHLHGKVRDILGSVLLASGDLILDIGSNDSTLLQAYPRDAGLLLAGIDPTGVKFRQYYPPHIQLVPDFFSAQAVRNSFGAKKAKVITSIAMFYDLESPLDFVKQVADTLAEDGVWVFEQSYMPTMLEINAYDTICHEHLEYYALSQVKWLMDRAGLRILDVELNAVNGGSFSVMAARQESPHAGHPERVSAVLEKEHQLGLETLKPFQEFRGRVFAHAEQLGNLVKEIRARGETILGYGASTKGNVILQFCGLTEQEIPYIAEVNEDKFGCYTPGTGIPIISEKEARAMHPDCFLVLPWHFRDGLVAREKAYLQGGGRLLFPLPRIEFVTA